MRQYCLQSLNLYLILAEGPCKFGCLFSHALQSILAFLRVIQYKLILYYIEMHSFETMNNNLKLAQIISFLFSSWLLETLTVVRNWNSMQNLTIERQSLDKFGSTYFNTSLFSSRVSHILWYFQTLQYQSWYWY